MTNEQLTNYLNQVRTALDGHPETDEIIDELHAHIWDYAHTISRSGATLDNAFAIAIQSMEDPNTLAQSFKQEIPATSSWKEPRSVLPEKKLTDKDFLYLGVIGFLAASIIISILSMLSDSTGIDLEVFNPYLYGLQLLIVIALILGFLYYRNEQEFQAQLQKLHQRFQNLEDSMDGKKKNQLERAFTSHFEGLFELVFSAFFLVGIIYVSFIARWPVFTQTWYDFMVYISLFLAMLEIFRGALNVSVGEIRVSRLINAIIGMFSLLGSILLIIFYPLDLVAGFDALTNPVLVQFASWVKMTYADPDAALRVFFGIVAVFESMSIVYNLVKFGVWKSSDHRSLTVTKTGETA